MLMFSPAPYPVSLFDSGHHFLWKETFLTTDYEVTQHQPRVSAIDCICEVTQHQPRVS
eukprot:gene4647-6804_t